MSLIARWARPSSRLRPPKYTQGPRWRVSTLALASQAVRRQSSTGGMTLTIDEELEERNLLEDRVDYEAWVEYKTSLKPVKQHPNFELKRCIPSSQIGAMVTAVGFLGKPKNMGATMTFANLEGGPSSDQIQLLARTEFSEKARQALRTTTPHSAVKVTGSLHLKYEPKDQKPQDTPDEGTVFISQLEIRLEDIQTLNTFKRQVNPGTISDPTQRDLQIRLDKGLRDRLRFRSYVAEFSRRHLSDFQEVETPILFKSTPEGAREFLVPTRNPGTAYGLPQSPQQYKQILMASGIYRYVQFAKCFRDEDHRADRQPEFTQIDLEMAWSDGEGVIQRVERFVKALWARFQGQGAIKVPLSRTSFPRLAYNDAMNKYGSDKPDLRIPGEIARIDEVIPPALGGMLTSLQEPVVEIFRFRLNGTAKVAQTFIGQFMDSQAAEPFKQNDDGAPGIFVYDPRRPLEGLQAFEFECADHLKELYAEEFSGGDLQEGDILLVQARPKSPHTGGSTMVGKLRAAIYKAALAQKLIKPDLSHRFLWVTDFPMFTLDDSTDPGQGGSSGFSATHHPFTAPKTDADLDLLLTNPLEAKADHYDLVLNGVELGGGSRRIHSSAIQKFVLRDIIKIPEKRLETFSHLLKALDGGCPPHAGLAIGFDRLVAVMQGCESVRDVITFPKNSNGEDPMVQSPSLVDAKQLQDYHLKILDNEPANDQKDASGVRPSNAGDLADAAKVSK